MPERSSIISRSNQTGQPSLTWVYDHRLTEELDRATWLETAAALADLGWQVTLVTVDAPVEAIGRCIRVVCLPRPRVYLLGYLLFHVRLLLYIVRKHTTIGVLLFHQDAALFLLPVAIVRRLLRRRLPRVVMDSRTLPMRNVTFRERARALMFHVANALANHLADGQTAITGHLAHAAGISERQLLGIWPSGVGLEDFNRAASERAWCSEETPLRLIYVGTLRPERNLLALCRAVAAARAEGLDVTLAIVGGGPQYAELRAFASSTGGSAVTVQAAVSHDRVPAVLAKADVGVLPFPDLPQFRVSSPVKLFEYMAAGLPVLATRVSCHTDVLGTTACAFWAEDGNESALLAAIRVACSHRSDLPGMGSQAQLAAQNWTWESSAKKLSLALQRSLGL